MRLFKKQTPDSDNLRRRPVPTQPSARRSQAFSYYAQRSSSTENTGRGQLDPLERQNMKSAGQKLLENRFVISMGLVALLAGAIYMLALSGPPKIVPLAGHSNSVFLHDNKSYQEAAQRSLGSSIINKNKLTIDTHKLAADLKRSYPEIDTVTVVLPVFGHTPIMYVEPYTPSFIVTTTSSTAFLLDATGRALASTSQLNDVSALNVPTLQDKSGLEIKLGEQALPHSTVSFIQTVVTALRHKKVGIATMVLPPAASEIDVFVAGTPYYAKFNIEGDALQQAGTFLAAKQRLERDHVMPAQYIDVRVPERAYYK